MKMFIVKGGNETISEYKLRKMYIDEIMKSSDLDGISFNVYTSQKNLVPLYEDKFQFPRREEMHKVVFDFVNDLGEWKTDSLTNDGFGFTMEDAKSIADQLRQNGHRNVTIEIM